MMQEPQFYCASMCAVLISFGSRDTSIIIPETTVHPRSSFDRVLQQEDVAQLFWDLDSSLL